MAIEKMEKILTSMNDINGAVIIATRIQNQFCDVIPSPITSFEPSLTFFKDCINTRCKILQGYALTDTFQAQNILIFFIN